MKLKQLITSTFIIVLVFCLVSCGAGGGVGGGMGLGLAPDQHVDQGERGGDFDAGGEDAGAFVGAAQEGLAGGLGGADRGIGQDAPGDFGKSGHSAPIEPVGIPVTIAKAEKPNVKRIVVTLVDEEGEEVHESPEGEAAVMYVMLQGLPGAVPNPAKTPYVYFFNSLTGERIIIPVLPDGSFEATKVPYQPNNPIAIAVYKDETIGVPVYFKPNSFESYAWYADTQGTIIAQGLFFFNDQDPFIVAFADDDQVELIKLPADSDENKAGDIKSEFNEEPGTKAVSDFLDGEIDSNKSDEIAPTIKVVDFAGKEFIPEQTRTKVGSVVFKVDDAIYKADKEVVRTIFEPKKKAAIRQWQPLDPETSELFNKKMDMIAVRDDSQVSVVDLAGVIVYEYSEVDMSVEDLDMLNRDFGQGIQEIIRRKFE